MYTAIKHECDCGLHLQVLCFELMEASKGKYSDSILQLMTDSADELVKELVTKMEMVSCNNEPTFGFQHIARLFDAHQRILQ